MSPGWVLDSLERGECQDTAGYRVETAAAEPDSSMKSDASCHATMPISTRPGSRSTNESQFNNTSMINNTSSANVSVMNNTTLPIHNTSLVDELDMKVVKQSGMFLDGCRIFLAGFSREDEAHLARGKLQR